MMNRLIDGLLYPKEILKYVKDNVFLVILYVLMFALLAGTRSAIDIIKYDGTTLAFQDELRDDLDHVDVNCEITNSVLVCDENTQEEIYKLSLIKFHLDSNTLLDTSDYDVYYNVIFNEDSVKLVFGNQVMVSLPIEDLPAEFHNLDFRDIQTENSDAFFTRLFAGIDSYLVDTKILWGSVNLAIEFLLNTLMFMFFVLIGAFFLKRRHKIIPFRDAFVLHSYSSTSVFIVIIFFNLLQLSFFLVIILIIIAFRQNNVMLLEIESRLKKPLDK
jgi:hypothetical protein